MLVIMSMNLHIGTKYPKVNHLTSHRQVAKVELAGMFDKQVVGHRLTDTRGKAMYMQYKAMYK